MDAAMDSFLSAKACIIGWWRCTSVFRQRLLMKPWKWQEAEQMLTQAILEAETDYLMLPFVENYRYLKKLLLRCQKQESLFVRYLLQMGEMYEMGMSKERGTSPGGTGCIDR